MQKRSGTVSWRHLGGCVALLACLAAGRPAWADGPQLTLSLYPDKQSVSPNEVISYQMTLDNFGSETVPNARVRIIFLDHADYISGSASKNGVAIPDQSGNPFLAGVAVGNVGPGQEIPLGFRARVMGSPDSPVKVQAAWESDLTGTTPTPITYTTVSGGKSNLEFQKVADKSTASPGRPSPTPSRCAIAATERRSTCTCRTTSRPTRTTCRARRRSTGRRSRTGPASLRWRRSR